MATRSHSMQFGLFFNQPLRGVSCTPSLQELELGYCFNHTSLCTVRWPSSLQRLKLGREFNQDIGVVRWPLFKSSPSEAALLPRRRDKVPASFQRFSIGGKKVTSITRRATHAR